MAYCRKCGNRKIRKASDKSKHCKRCGPLSKKALNKELADG